MLRKWALICKITEVRKGSMYTEQSQDAWRDGEGTRCSLRLTWSRIRVFLSKAQSGILCSARNMVCAVCKYIDFVDMGASRVFGKG